MSPKRQSHSSWQINLIIEAISPALIIGMICSLVFFLVFAFYRGEFDLRLMYILGLFTFGVVLIARIAIESGRTYASAFSIPMAIVAILAMMRFVTVQGDLAPLNWLFNVGLLALIWYLADRITYDCTLDDRKRKIRQEGLLQSLGLVKRSLDCTESSNQAHDSSPPHIPLAQQNELTKPPGSSSKAKHNPGVWVLRFALLALPLFGFGQLVIADAAARSLSFWFLFGYLGFALGLLVCTSLLSLRRYLHHRGADIPLDVVSIWLGSGAIGIFIILTLCILLPLPGRTLGLIELPFEVGSPDGLLSSRFGWGSEGVNDKQDSGSSKSKSDEGEPSGDLQPGGKGPAEISDNAAKDAPQKNSNSEKQSDSSTSNDSSDTEPSKRSSEQRAAKEKESASRQPSNPNTQPDKKSDVDANANQRDHVGDTKQDESSQEQPADKSAQKPPLSASQSEQPAEGARNKEPSRTKTSTNQPQFNFNNFMNAFNTDFATLFKWLTIATLVLIVVIYAITHPREVVRFLRDVADFLAALFGRKRVMSVQPLKGTQQQKVELMRVLAPFSSYANPFQSGEHLSGVQLVERTFVALEAWAAEAGVARNQDETSREFAGRLVSRIPKLGKTPAQAANMLDQVMFAGWKPITTELQPLEQLWRVLTKSS